MPAVDLGELYSVSPEEFVATRSKLVAALKADQRRDDAAAIQKLRRPRLAEHALNRAARTQPKVVERWAAAVAAVHAAQSQAIGGGGGAADLRAAAGELRAAHAAVLATAVDALGAGGAAQRDDIAETLRALAHPEGAPLLRAGLVGSEQLGDLELFAGAPDPVVQRPATTAPAPAGHSKKAASRPKQSKRPVAATPAAPKFDAKQRTALERAAAAARKQAQAADAALLAARAAVLAAKEAVAAATDRAASARQAARNAAAALDTFDTFDDGRG